MFRLMNEQLRLRVHACSSLPRNRACDWLPPELPMIPSGKEAYGMSATVTRLVAKSLRVELRVWWT